MKVISSVAGMQRTAEELRRKGGRIALVPTMGYLHKGHESLVRIAAERADVVITSIFVNPAQFAPGEDFERYPRDLPRDTRIAEGAGTGILFTPSVEEVYPGNYHTYVIVEELTTVLEGKARPTHFRGVTTVVTKLFHWTKPHLAVFGQKDAQQCAVIRRMVKDLNFDIDIVVAPTVREQDGLAMSSRNAYLSPDERQQSTVLYRSLQLAEQMIRGGERGASAVADGMKRLITSQPAARVDYVSVADAQTLQEVDTVPPGSEVLVSLAVRFGATRLIDNVLIKT
jgi:pantoate--beta-alanine ligase